MSQKRRPSRKTESKPKTDTTPEVVAPLLPTLDLLATEIQAAQQRFNRLQAENQQLQEQTARQEHDLALLRQQHADLQAEYETLKGESRLLKDELAQNRKTVLREMFSDMADERHNRLLRKLLSEETAPDVLNDLRRYLREELQLALVGQIGSEFVLEEMTLSGYEVQEQLSLPCRVRFVGRGITFAGQPILRPLVEPLEESEHGN